MIDFIKYQIKDCDVLRLEQNEVVDFIDEVNTSTGELGKYKVARYRGLKISMFYPTISKPNYRVFVSGSLHKYWNKGKHNFNDFGSFEFKFVVNDLFEKFGFHPQNCILKSFEVGVNIKPPTKTEAVLNGCILHKTTPFEVNTYKRKGHYKQAGKQQYIVKIYDKGLQYKGKGFNVSYELLRFEIRFLKMQPLKQLGIFTIQDLLGFGLENFKPLLIRQWENVLFYDTIALSSIKNKYEYNNPKYWIDLNPNNFKYHRNNLNRLTRHNNGNLKNQVSTLINDKINFLTKILPELTL